MLWSEEINNYLYLPISNGNPLLDVSKCKISQKYKVKQTKEFKKCWNNPKLNTDKEICSNLLTLLKTCSMLILIAQKTINNYEKTSKQDLVTEADIGIEKIIRYWFKKHLPTHIIIGEEMSKNPIKQKDTVWYLDPIDGTSNYTKQSEDFCINLGSTFNGCPYINIIYYPAKNTYYYQTPSSNSYQFKIPPKETLCSEFYPNRKTESEVFKRILEKTNYTPFKTNALGVSLLKMIEGKISTFYKLNVKPWDIIAGAAILSSNKNWDITLVLKDNSEISPFSNSKNFIDHLNMCFSDNCRIGTLIITLKSQKKIKDIIINEVHNL